MRVLFTREMSDPDLDLARKWGLEPVVEPLIRIEPVGWQRILSEHPDFWDELGAAKAVVFTSRNGVWGVAEDPEFIRILKKKPVYTVGESTADALEPYGILARFPDDYNAVTLAKMMLMDGVHTQIIHFCGDVRRPELGIAMKEAGISVTEVVVYEKTVLKPEQNIHPETKKSGNMSTADAVVFFSPSAVKAFWDQDKQAGFEGVWFAIGQTTASALRELGIEPLVPRASTSELMIEFIGKYFRNI